MKLEMNAMPKSLWGKNPRNKMGRKAWDIKRKSVYKKANFTCEICGFKTKFLDCHEAWTYNDILHEAKMTQYMAICKYCHRTIHIANSERLGFDIPKLIQHFCKVNNVDEVTYTICREELKAKQDERNKYAWYLVY